MIKFFGMKLSPFPKTHVFLIVTSHNRIELKFIFLLYAEAITLVTA